jgi:anaerobic selenocysteine-containing dehydrogenase
MKKAILAIAAAATLAAGTMTVPTTADARCYGCAVGAGVAAGVIGGAIIGSAIANAQPRGGYVVYEGYNAPYPRGCPGGYWARQRLYDRYGNFVGWSRPHFICP